MSTPKTIGRYEILDELGHGAMGSVFRARDPAMDRIVALKTIHTMALASEQGGEFRQRFYREARAAGALAHPGIVPVFDVGEDEGMPYLVMEYVKGQTLDHAIKKGERFSLERVCEIGQQIAEALGYAHHNGVIHRDIKPANILLTLAEAYGSERPKITDFGVAKLTAGEITTTGQLLGTPAFMPPEQFTGMPIDNRADLFSLGVILYWMATGEQPFHGETMTAVSYKIVHTEPIPPAKLNPAIPAKLEGLILKCLAKNPANRYQTGEEIAQELALLRADSKASSLQSTAPLSRGTGKASEDTFDLNSTLPSNPPSAAGAKTAKKQSQPATKRDLLLVTVVVLIAAVVVGGWYRRQLRHHARQQTTSEATSSSQPEMAPIPAPIAEPETTPTGTNSAAVSSAPRAQTPAVAFNPKTLDSKQNTRLKIELDHFPPNLAFTIEMDKKIYFKGAAGDKASFDNLYVPPGVHEFRVTVRGGSVQKASNIASAEFLANKHMTLKVEFRPSANKSSGVSTAFDTATQIIATLRADRFFR
ncbi:MAG: serine/threonine-protein kinase [Terracidiphilus sp.]|jgi:serine/threonine-protein kinase